MKAFYLLMLYIASTSWLFLWIGAFFDETWQQIGVWITWACSMAAGTMAHDKATRKDETESL